MDEAKRNGPAGRRRAGWRATKIVATIGPAAERTGALGKLLRAGDRFLSRLPALSGAMVVEVSGAARAEGATNAVRIRRVPDRRPS